ncbi:MAG: hypothetical protein MRY74_11480 [Neomegalonema sp.]|nr:hypothetical protein [Neomegalonema sp.]
MRPRLGLRVGLRAALAACALALFAALSAAEAQSRHTLTDAEYGAFRSAFERFAKRLTPFNGGAVARFMPRRIAEISARAQGVSLKSYMAAAVESGAHAGFRISNVALEPPTAPVAAIATDELRCVVTPIAYDSEDNGVVKRLKADLLAIRDRGVWSFMIAPRGPLRKVQIRRFYGKFICSL